MFAFILEWFFLALALVLIIPAFAFLDSKSFGKSSFFMVASVAALVWFFWNDVVRLVLEFGLAKTIIVLSTGYVVAGVVTSFVYWIFFCWKARERFQRHLNGVTRSSLVSEVTDRAKFDPTTFSDLFYISFAKFRVLQHEAAHIFDGALERKAVPSTSDLSWKVSAEAVTKEVEDAVAAVLPPRFSHCKDYVVWSGIVWPLTLLWLLCSRVVKQLIERIVSMFGGTFDALSKLAFGKV